MWHWRDARRRKDKRGSRDSNFGSPWQRSKQRDGTNLLAGGLGANVPKKFAPQHSRGMPPSFQRLNLSAAVAEPVPAHQATLHLKGQVQAQKEEGCGRPCLLKLAQKLVRSFLQRDQMLGTFP